MQYFVWEILLLYVQTLTAIPMRSYWATCIWMLWMALKYLTLAFSNPLCIHPGHLQSCIPFALEHLPSSTYSHLLHTLTALMHSTLHNSNTTICTGTLENCTHISMLRHDYYAIYLKHESSYVLVYFLTLY